MTQDPQSFAEVYAATTYRVGACTLRVGEHAPWLDTILENRGLDTWAFLTAWNPRSEPQDDATNRAAMRVLESRLEGKLWLRGIAVADDGAWPDEPSILVMGMPREEALELARAFEQNAILVGTLGGPVELVFTTA